MKTHLTSFQVFTQTFFLTGSHHNENKDTNPFQNARILQQHNYVTVANGEHACPFRWHAFTAFHTDGNFRVASFLHNKAPWMCPDVLMAG